jgi:hypothetical protein
MRLVMSNVKKPISSAHLKVKEVRPDDLDISDVG